MQDYDDNLASRPSLVPPGRGNRGHRVPRGPQNSSRGFQRGGRGIQVRGPQRGNGGGGGGRGARQNDNDTPYNNNLSSRRSTEPVAGGSTSNDGNGSANGNHPPPPERRDRRNPAIPIFGYRRLYGFLSEDSDKVIMAINRNLDDWEELIENKLSKDIFVLIIHILGEKVCSDSILNQAQLNVISKTLGQKFTLKWSETSGSMLTPDDNFQFRMSRNENDMQVDHSRNRILTNLYKIFSFVASKMATTAIDYVQNLLPGILGIISVANLNADPAMRELQTQYRELTETISSLVKKKKEQQEKIARLYRFGFTPREEEQLHGMTPPNDFREISIVPAMEEIMSVEEPFLRSNKRLGAYNDADHYLDVQFRLLREDFLQPLKNGIQDFMKHKHDYLAKKKKMPMGNVRIYPGVQLLRIQLVRDTITHSLQLPESMHKRVKWDRSKRLLQGSLIVLTSDNFLSAYFAIVFRRDLNDLKKGIFDVVWEGPSPDFSNRKVEEFLMIECEVYFEAYRYTLQILKEIQLETFHMAKFIVNGSSDVGPPAYLKNSEHQLCIDDTYFSPLQGPWPNAKQLKLDDTQFEAFHAAITNEFAIIQGPPGTGKTFLGLKIAEVFLNNLPIWWGEDNQHGNGPILVVCYTNHALDQFLEGILHVLTTTFPDEDPAMIRVGGRSKSEDLEPFSLQRQRATAGRLQKYDRDYWSSKTEAVRAVRDLEYCRAEVMNQNMALGNLGGIINFESLTVWGKLGLVDEFPIEVWNLLKNPKELGLTDEVFSHPGFSIDQLLNGWFKLLDVPSKMAYPQKQTQQPRKNQTNHDKELVDSDSEDYDVEELQRDRLVEELYNEELNSNMSKTNVQIAQKNVTYIAGISLREYEKQHKHATESMIKIQENQNLSQFEKMVQIEGIQKFEYISENKSQFLETLFTFYKNDLLDLPNVEDLLNPTPGRSNSFTSLSLPEKWALFFGVVEKAKTLTTQLVNSIQVKVMEAQKKLKEIQTYGDGFLLRHTKICGMTTTGAAKYNDLLKMMKSKIVIVEEAAEVLEAHIVTAITKHCQHLILIGDHQQLRPSTTVYELSTKYNLDISLFERMLNNHLHCHKLKVQHRMRPEICYLILGTIYQELENHASVLDYPEVDGMAKNLFFIAHHEHEKSESDSMSKANPHEAEFLACLCRYLVQQGYSTDRITVLTTYTGQMFLLKQEIRKFPTCVGVRVTVVDNFQGEENDIILLSLVRSNEKDSIGFLKTSNRICVAISRAKHGLFIVGNMDMLSSKSKTWKQIEEKLVDRDEIGESLELICQIHHTITPVTSSSDFKKVPEGGCSLLCAAKLKCGHECRSVCHIQDRAHIDYKCKQPCEKFCVNHHLCIAFCFKPCPPCPTPMDKTLPCQHVKRLPCHVPEASIKCMEPVLKKLPCGHKETIACSRDPKEIKCKVKVTRTLRCGHEKENVECHIDSSTILCKEIVDKILVPCGHSQRERCHSHPEMVKCDTMIPKLFSNCGHQIEIKCQNSKTPIDCKTPCPIRLECGHACTKVCHVDSDPNHLEYTCRKECGRSCLNGHRCATNHKCSQKCPPCEQLMDKTMACKVHTSKLECHVDPATVECNFECAKILPECEHPCGNLCFQPCGPCMILINKPALCGHRVETPCSEEPSSAMCRALVPPTARATCGHTATLRVPCNVRATITPDEIVKFCNQPCRFQFVEKDGGCGHWCKGTCSECLQGRIHKKCQEKCGRQFVCGHVCSFPCAEACRPCSERCILKCEHSECGRTCGEPCTDCTEKCNWKCEHKECTKLCRELCDRGPCDEPCKKKLKCGHECIGFCGEPCPPHCRVCNKVELTNEFFLLGTEGDEDSRFVYLEDCKHSIEHEGLEYHLTVDNNGEIGAKNCPRCTTLIRKSRRYGDIVRNTARDVMAVKRKAFGNEAQIRVKSVAIVGQVRGNPLWKRILPDVQTFIIAKLVDIVTVHLRTGVKNERLIYKKDVHIQSLSSIEVIVKHANDVVNLLTEQAGTEVKLKPDLLKSLESKYRELFLLLITRDLPLSLIEHRDFDREFDRLYDLKQVYLRRSSPRFTDGHSQASAIYTNVMAIVSSPRIYTDAMKASIYRHLKEIDDCIKTGLGISERERLEVLRAINSAAGRWFKCPNGHIYLIGDCGGATIESKCNECGATIGGGSHRLRSDNALATEMDGATQPLYPGMV